jgi:hypothetical protein
MMEQPCNFALWIPVIGTLGGALVGLAASSLIAYFNRSSEAKKSKDERDRSRLERMYELLIIIKMERQNELGEAINWIHNEKLIMEKEVRGIPPLIELEMLVRLYFPVLETQREKLMGAIHRHGKEFFDVRDVDYRKKEEKEKQSATSVLVELSRDIDKEVTNMQSAIAKVITA